MITEFTTAQDVPKQALPAAQVADWCKELNFSDIQINVDPAAALEKLLQRPEDILLVTGSFYLLNHIRPLIMWA